MVNGQRRGNVRRLNVIHQRPFLGRDEVPYGFDLPILYACCDLSGLPV